MIKMASISEILADYYLEMKAGDIPKEVLNKASECVLDYLGCALGGAHLDSSRMVRESMLLSGLQGVPEGCTVMLGGRAPADKAAFINAAFGHGLEMDDVLNEASLHPGVVIIPTALALSEKLGASGLDILISIIVGYDLVSRIGQAVNPSSHYKRGFHPTSTCGTFAAALTAGKLLNLNKAQVVNALGIAGSFTSGNLECYADGSLTKRLQPGIAAQGGMYAALLAAQGYTGPRWIFEGTRGFLKGYTDAGNQALLTRNLNYNELEIKKTSIKPYACCRYNQTPIDVALRLTMENNLDYREIKEIVIRVVGTAGPIVCEPKEVKYNPQNIVDAQFSLPYSVAVALIKRRASVAEYSENVLYDKEIRELMPKVKTEHSPELDKVFPRAWPAEGIVLLKNGARYQARVDYCKGDPENPLSREELEQKFVSLAGLNILDKGRLDKIINVVNTLEQRNIQELTQLLGGL